MFHFLKKPLHILKAIAIVVCCFLFWGLGGVVRRATPNSVLSDKALTLPRGSDLKVLLAAEPLRINMQLSRKARVGKCCSTAAGKAAGLPRSGQRASSGSEN